MNTVILKTINNTQSLNKENLCSLEHKTFKISFENNSKLNISLNIPKFISNIKQTIHGIIPIYLMFKLPPTFLNFVIIMGYFITTLFIYTKKSKEEDLDITVTLFFMIIMCMLIPGYVDISF